MPFFGINKKAWIENHKQNAKLEQQKLRHKNYQKKSESLYEIRFFFSQINQIDGLIIFTYSFLSLSWMNCVSMSSKTTHKILTQQKNHPISIFFFACTDNTVECAYKINVEEEFIVPESTNLSTKWIRIIRIIQTILFA